MPRRTVFDIDGLEEMAEAFGHLGKYAIPDAAQEALNAVSRSSITEMATQFEREIAGGPVQFTRPKPGRRDSSVLAKTPRGATKGQAESSIYVQKAQSTYLKYQLGEDNDGVRKAGDVGAASEYNFVPDPQALRKHQGISLTSEGNLPKNAIRTLIRRADSQRKRDRAKNKELSSDELDDLRIRRRDRMGLRRKDAFIGDRRDKSRTKDVGRARLGINDIWFGKRNYRGGREIGPVGFWQRPKKALRHTKPILLVAAVEKSDYGRRGKLTPAWNEAVLEAAGNLPKAVRRRMADALDKMAASKAARRGRRK